MTPPIQIGHADDESSRAALAAAIRAWEPALDLVATRDDPRIYEPDGTLYAVGRGPEVNLLVRHKVRPFRAGDMIVVPRAVAIDAEEPGASYVAIFHDGIPPYHFRERFVQTWGYEHRPAATEDSGWISDDVVPNDDPRFRVPYRRSRIDDGSIRDASGLDLHLLIGMEGEGRVGNNDSEIIYDVRPGNLLLVGVGVNYWVEGQVVVGRLILRAESVYEARLATAVVGPESSPSPEFRPGG
jgi:hypothetical protein